MISTKVAVISADKATRFTDRVLRSSAGVASAAICSLGAGLLIPTGMAFAQTAPSAGAQSASDLIEVTVTATRREQSLIEVPISISVLSGADLEKHNVQNVEDYARLIPNVSFQHTGNFAAVTSRDISIRGIQGGGVTAFYIDDTPVPTSIDPRVLDIARVEVLRGPQGTLFGESSMGGAVRLITNQPDTHNFSSQYTARGGYTTGAATPNGGLSGVVNFAAIPDKLGIRVVGFVDHQGGWLKRTYLNDPYNPANAGFELDPVNFPYVGGTSTQDDLGSTNEFGASVAARLEVTSNFNVTARLLYQYTKLKGWQTENGLIATPTEDLTGHPRLLGRFPVKQFPFVPYGMDRFYLPSLDLSYTGPGFTLFSSSSYYNHLAMGTESDREGEAQILQPGRGWAAPDGINFTDTGVTPEQYALIPTQDFIWTNGQRQHTWTQEVRAVIDPIPIGSALNVSAVLGYYWHKSGPDRKSPYSVKGCNQSGCAPRGYSIGFAAAGIWANDQDWIIPDDNSYNVDSSFYGEIDFKLFDHLTLTAGDRYYRLTDFNSGVSNWYGWTAAALAPTPAIPGTRKDTGHSPRFSATYAFNPDASVYLQAARGFRQGRAASANQILPPACDQDLIDLGFDPANGTGYGPDSIWNYEAGTKFRLRDPNMALSFSVYDMEWNNIQQNITLACFYGFTANSGAATSRGGELEATINPVEGLSLRFAAGYEDAHITEPAFGSTQKVGDRLKLVPKYTGSLGFMYTFPTAMNFGGASGNLFISSDYSYTGDRLSSNSSASYTVTIPSYYQVNARVGMEFENSTLSLNVDNVTNGRNNLTDGINQGWGMGQFGTIIDPTGFVPIPVFYVTRPRTWMLEFSHHM